MLEALAVLHANSISHCAVHPDSIYVHSCQGKFDDKGVWACNEGCDYENRAQRAVPGPQVLTQLSRLQFCVEWSPQLPVDVSYVSQAHSVMSPYWSSPELCSLASKPKSKMRKKAIRESGGRSDIWSVGILAMTLIERNLMLIPAYRRSKDSLSTAALKEMNAKQIARLKSDPRIVQARKWTTLAQDFVQSCLRRNFQDRPSAATLLKHPFLSNQTETVLTALSDISESDTSAALEDTYEDDTLYIPAPESDSLGASSDQNFWSEDEDGELTPSHVAPPRSPHKKIRRQRGMSSSIEADLDASSDGSTGSVVIVAAANASDDDSSTDSRISSPLQTKRSSGKIDAHSMERNRSVEKFSKVSGNSASPNAHLAPTHLHTANGSPPNFTSHIYSLVDTASPKFRTQLSPSREAPQGGSMIQIDHNSVSRPSFALSNTYGSASSAVGARGSSEMNSELSAHTSAPLPSTSSSLPQKRSLNHDRAASDKGDTVRMMDRAQFRHTPHQNRHRSRINSNGNANTIQTPHSAPGSARIVSATKNSASAASSPAHTPPTHSYSVLSASSKHSALRDRTPSPVRMAMAKTLHGPVRRSSMPLLPITDLAPNTPQYSTTVTTLTSASSNGTADNSSFVSSSPSSHNSSSFFDDSHTSRNTQGYTASAATSSSMTMTAGSILSSSSSGTPTPSSSPQSSSLLAPTASSRLSPPKLRRKRSFGIEKKESRSHSGASDARDPLVGNTSDHGPSNSKSSEIGGDGRTRHSSGRSSFSSKASSMTEALPRPETLSKPKRSRSQDVLIAEETSEELRAAETASSHWESLPRNATPFPGSSSDHANQIPSLSGGHSSVGARISKSPESASPQAHSASSTPSSSLKNTPRKKVKKTRLKSEDEERESVNTGNSNSPFSSHTPQVVPVSDPLKIVLSDEALQKEIAECESKWIAEIRKRERSFDSREKELMDKYASKLRSVKKRYDTAISGLTKREEARMEDLKVKVSEDKTKLFSERQKEIDKDDSVSFVRRNSFSAISLRGRHLSFGSDSKSEKTSNSPTSPSGSGLNTSGNSNSSHVSSGSANFSSPTAAGSTGGRETKKTQFGKSVLHLNHEKLVYEMDRRNILDRHELECKTLEESAQVERDYEIQKFSVKQAQLEALHDAQRAKMEGVFLLKSKMNEEIKTMMRKFVARKLKKITDFLERTEPISSRRNSSDWSQLLASTSSSSLVQPTSFCTNAYLRHSPNASPSAFTALPSSGSFSSLPSPSSSMMSLPHFSSTTSTPLQSPRSSQISDQKIEISAENSNFSAVSSPSSSGALAVSPLAMDLSPDLLFAPLDVSMASMERFHRAVELSEWKQSESLAVLSRDVALAEEHKTQSSSLFEAQAYELHELRNGFEAHFVRMRQAFVSERLSRTCRCELELADLKYAHLKRFVSKQDAAENAEERRALDEQLEQEKNHLKLLFASRKAQLAQLASNCLSNHGNTHQQSMSSRSTGHAVVPTFQDTQKEKFHSRSPSPSNTPPLPAQHDHDGILITHDTILSTVSSPRDSLVHSGSGSSLVSAFATSQGISNRRTSLDLP